MNLSHRSGRYLAASLLIMAAAGCGERAGDAATPGLAAGARSAAAAASASNHAIYAANGISCETCHPCGVRSPDGHEAPWMDASSAGFHAHSANAGLSACQICHGPSLDGAGGTTAVSCARCHGPSWRTNCTMCHGGVDLPSGAPPRATWGNAGDAVRVGAHTAHLVAGHGLSRPVECATCHEVPADALSPGHLDGPAATVAFAGLATAGGAAPVWNRAEATCASTYCHGATLAGGGVTAPVWTRQDGTPRACDACHGAPPPPPHVASVDCGACHTGYSASAVVAATHVDGKLDVIALACNSCHGSAASPAPPYGTRGEVATTTLAVGAHQRHLGGGPVSRPLACAECHLEPTSASHSDGSVELAFGPLATTGGAVPAWDRASATCSASYCHGQFPGGNARNAPVWTTVDGTQAACGTCHGTPPPEPHPQNPNCGGCHEGYGATTVNLATHVDGAVQISAMACNSCHGNAQNAAPPAGTRGESLTTEIAVGAHQSHLSGGPYSNPIACSECHLVPATLGHADGTALVAFGPLATAGGASPAWDRAAASCSASYCHGQFEGGDLLNEPLWTKVDGTQAACGTCHGAPPPPPHSTLTSCGSCHDGYTQAAVNLALHVNGSVEARASPHPAGWADRAQHGTQANLTGLSGCKPCHGDLGPTTSCGTCHAAAGFPTWDVDCTFCHGSTATTRSNPPVDVQGRGVATDVSVGVHESHATTTIATFLACTQCHPARTTSVVADAAHVDGDGIAEVAFGPLARTGGAAATYARTSATSATCSSTYCHGRFSGGTGATVSWTSTSQVTCTSCHGNPPDTGKHKKHVSDKRIACYVCHNAVVNSSNGFVDRTLHVNGVDNVKLGGTHDGKTVTGTWNASNRSCSNLSCHGSKSW